MIFKTDINQEVYTDERCFITEILNTKSIQNISIARARVEPKVTTDLHTLTVDEIYYVLEGRGMIEIDHDTKKEIGKGDIAFIKAGSSQRITNIIDSDLLFICICTPRFTFDTYTSIEAR